MKNGRKYLSMALSAALLTGTLAGTMAGTASAAEFKVETIVAPQYDEVRNFTGNLAAVRQGEKWGYIDKENNMVIAPQFDLALDFSEGVAVVAYATPLVNYDGDAMYKLALLYEDGSVVDLTYDGALDYMEPGPVPCTVGKSYAERNSDVWRCQEGVVRAGDMCFTWAGEHITVMYQGEEHSFRPSGPCVGGVIAGVVEYFDGPYNVPALIDKNGSLIHNWPEVDYAMLEHDHDVNTVYAPEQDRIVYSVYTTKEVPFTDDNPMGVEEEYLVGVMDSQYNTVVAPAYTNFRYWTSGVYFSDGLFAVCDVNGKYGCLDRNGNVVIPFEYDFLSSFNEGLCAAKKDGKAFFIDRNNQRYEVGGLNGGIADAESAGSLYNGMAAVYDRTTGTAYCVQNVPQGNVLPAIPGTEKLGMEYYFPGHVEGSDDYDFIRSVGDTIVIEENGKWGFASTSTTLDLPSRELMADWAYDEVCKAIQANLVPQPLQNQYKINIERADFAATIMQTIRELTGKTNEELVRDLAGKDLDEMVLDLPFNDVRDNDVLAAYALGIINGVGDKKFAPHATIKRQDAATMLVRGVNAVWAEKGAAWSEESKATPITFSDSADIKPYAAEAVQMMANLEVMKGTGATTYSPNATYTRQQSYMTVYRLMTNLLDMAE